MSLENDVAEIKARLVALENRDDKSDENNDTHLQSIEERLQKLDEKIGSMAIEAERMEKWDAMAESSHYAQLDRFDTEIDRLNGEIESLRTSIMLLESDSDEGDDTTIENTPPEIEQEFPNVEKGLDYFNNRRKENRHE